MWLESLIFQLLRCSGCVFLALIVSGGAARRHWRGYASLDHADHSSHNHIATQVALKLPVSHAIERVSKTPSLRSHVTASHAQQDGTQSDASAFVRPPYQQTADATHKDGFSTTGRFFRGGTRSLRRLSAKGRGILSVESKTSGAVVKQYGAVFGPQEADSDSPPLIDPGDSTPDTMFSDLTQFMQDPRSKNAIMWRYPFLRTFPQRAALRTLTDFMPASRARECLNVTDGSNVDDLVDPTCQGYYCKRHIKAFFRYQPEFNYVRNGTEISPRTPEPPKLQLPPDMPPTEGSKERPSVPLGWRTFAALGLYHTATGISDPAVLWSGYRLTDGDPMGRLASGLYNSPLTLRMLSGRDAVMPNNTMLHSKHPIEQGEHFRGKKGDMSHLGPRSPRQHETINEDLYRHHFAEDGVWPYKHFETVVSEMVMSQALWARLSTTMLRSTAKVLRMYKLRVRKNFKQEVFSARRSTILVRPKPPEEEPVETSVGVLFFLTAPTLHHAVDLACSDPMARCNLYQQLLLFEVDDVLKYQIFKKRDPNRENPRQYLVLGSYENRDDHELLRDKMMRFIVRSNCVNTHVMLHAPRKDAMVDLSMPLQQFLPITTQQRDRLLDRLNNVRDACNTKNKSLPIGDLSIINQFDSDDAFDWARRSPYTRAGCYESLFVAKAYEVGFYGRNCNYVAPLPMETSLMPVKQEYAIVERDPVDVLRKRMSDGWGHVLALPKVIPRSSKLYRELAAGESVGVENVSDESSGNQEDDATDPTSPKTGETETDHAQTSWPGRLRITIRRTVSESFKASNVSSKHIAATRPTFEDQVKLGAVPFERDGTLAVDMPSPRVKVTDEDAPTHQRINGSMVSGMGAITQGRMYVVGRPDKSEVPGSAQTLPGVVLSTDAINRLLSENAPVELDTPFFADLLKDYVYVSLPAGDFFECPPGDDNVKYDQRGEDSKIQTGVGAEDTNRLPKNRPEAVAGFWIKKSECYLMYKNEEERFMLLGKAPSRLDRRRTLSDDMIKRGLIRNEVILDYVRKGAALTWPDLSKAYTRREGKLISHLTPMEEMKTMWTVDPLNKPYARYSVEDEVPAARFYVKPVEYSPDDPRHRMRHYPQELYKMAFEFMQKVDRGEARPEDDPLKALVEAEYVLPKDNNDSICTWEESELEAAKESSVEKTSTS
ncbi:hypothetical protein BOVATA_005370 [Babesia ovata]|uniref:Uncharacterized protein n=1 Tax=Babesia ovata TaxID=189622 RepID=A0A2H6K7T1_9APIC|nr:uncharacterized protein BOVATA_005370 [Babesia ovata]GBE59044.1 hypothetical protein BOVATA_005370 [Babesia ovata]